jgi:Zn-finger protein
MSITNRPTTGNTTYHRDGTVTVWDCIQQAWVRGNDPSDELLATLSSDEREKVINHIA